MGCLPKGVNLDVSKCLPDATIDASDVAKYRHFVVDDLHEIVYFCDVSPILKDGMLCYVSVVQDGAPNSWRGTLSRFPKTSFLQQKKLSIT